MDKYKETFQTWNKIAALYQEKFMDLDLYDDTYDYFLEAIPVEKAQILEIGCGPGNISRYLLSKNADLNIIGIDIAPNMVELAKQNNPEAQFEVLDSRNIRTLNQTFQGIIVGFCVPYLSHYDVAQLIEDSAALLSDRGILYLSFVEGDYEKSGFISGSSGDRTYFYYHNLDFLKGKLESNGFHLSRVDQKRFTRGEESTEMHTILIAQKE